MSRILALVLLLNLPCTMHLMGQDGNNSSQDGGEKKKNYPSAESPVITSENSNVEKGWINFQDASFELPGKAWHCKKNDKQIDCARSEKQYHSQVLSFWPVRFPASLRGLDMKQHSSNIFQYERQKERFTGTSWKFVEEDELKIGEKVYPTMRFTVDIPGTTPPVKQAGLFPLYFLEDFHGAQRFYSFFWVETYPAADKGNTPHYEVLDSAVSSLRVTPQPRESPLVAAQPPKESSAAQLPKESSELPTLAQQALIAGVPFIKWRDAARLEYQDKDILNPSFAASLGMILKYWGQDLNLLKKSSAALPKGPGGWGVVEQGQAKSLSDLKAFVARGIPVFITPAVTPVAHQPSPSIASLAAVRGLKLDQGGPQSGVLGRMLPLEFFPQMEDLVKISPWESLLTAARVVIGYDDARQVVILHDPSFGPAWEAGYQDFEKMWGATKRFFIAPHPTDYETLLAKRPPGRPYPARTPDQEAAAHYVLGYALSAAGHTSRKRRQSSKRDLQYRGPAKAISTFCYSSLPCISSAKAMLKTP